MRSVKQFTSHIFCEPQTLSSLYEHKKVKCIKNGYFALHVDFVSIVT